MNAAPSLPRLKGRFPFSLAATSFVIPDKVLPNVRFLAPFVDEIQIVYFESRNPDSLPEEEEIAAIARAGKDGDVRFSVHLPIDRNVANPDPVERDADCRAMKEFVRRTAPLEPISYILHVPFPKDAGNADIRAGQKRCRGCLDVIAREIEDPSRLALENLEHGLAPLASLAVAKGLSLCLDVGHAIVHGPDPGALMAAHVDRVRMIHLHGVEGTRDHKSLKCLADEPWRVVRRHLATYKGSVCLEVFNLKDLAESMERMKELA